MPTVAMYEWAHNKLYDIEIHVCRYIGNMMHAKCYYPCGMRNASLKRFVVTFFRQTIKFKFD